LSVFCQARAAPPGGDRRAPRLDQPAAGSGGAGEALLAGMNAIVLAPTAGGKTEAAIFPTLSLLLDRPGRGCQRAVHRADQGAAQQPEPNAWVRTPRWSACADSCGTATPPATSAAPFLREPAELLMTTPESLEVMLVSERVDTAALFANLRIIIIDEIHALAGTDRGAHLLSVLERSPGYSRHDVQRVGLSATVGNPEAILGWLQGSSTRPGGGRRSTEAADPAPAADRASSRAVGPGPRRRQGRPGQQEPVLLPVALGH
jgi:ATP-dependent Lhr-like helicase